MTTRIILVDLLRQREAHLDLGTAPRRAGHARFAAQQCGALAQTEEPERIRLARILRGETDAVVAYADGERRILLLDIDVHARGARVLGDVGERLLDRAEHGGRLQLGKLELLRGDRQIAADSRV